MKKIIITAGGTGGHIFPGLAVAQLFTEAGDKVVWIGTPQGLETKLVPEYGILLLTISMQGLRGKGLGRLLKAPWLLLQAVLAARRLIKRESPDVVLGMGGYVSAPVGIAARLCKVPLVIHEQNAIAGMSNNMLAKIATRVCESFANTFPASTKAILTGNPVRPAIVALAAKKNQPLHELAGLKILILGGSQGAKAINQVIPGVLQRFQPVNGVQIWHQTGIADYDAVKASYQNKKLSPYQVDAFIADMAAAYAWADLVICRAGATTVAELAGIGLPAIFIPLPTAVDDHQTANAASLVKHGAAIILPQSELSCDRLFDVVQQLQSHPEQLHKMATQQAFVGHLDAATRLAEVCRGIMH